MWRNWQTQQTQNLPVATSYGFESHHRHTASLTVSGQGSFLLSGQTFGYPRRVPQTIAKKACIQNS